VTGDGDMPSQGALSNPNDKALVQALEDKMIEAYVPVIVELKCKAGAGGTVNLNQKMIRDCHAKALCKAVNKYEVKRLDLQDNQLGDAGAEAIAAMLRTNRSLTYINLYGNRPSPTSPEIGDRSRGMRSGESALLDAIEGREGFKLVLH